MTQIDVHKDPENLTMSVTAEFAAPPERVWQLWEDPHQLERWWGPPSHPATVTDHDLRPGGDVRYYMTGPEGDRYGGWWQVVEVDPPRRLVFQDGFADDDGAPNPDLPVTRTVVSIEARGDARTAMRLRTEFPSLEAMEQMLEMGVEQGIVEAVGQIDDILGAPADARA